MSTYFPSTSNYSPCLKQDEKDFFLIVSALAKSGPRPTHVELKKETSTTPILSLEKSWSSCTLSVGLKKTDTWVADFYYD